MAAMKINPERDRRLIASLVLLWERSVRASHRFLAEEDIRGLLPEVESGLRSVATLIVAYEREVPSAFMGIEAGKIEMLFVAPEYAGRGIGKELVALGIDEYGAQQVDVNEENPRAVGFYLSQGFYVCSRSDCDDRGRPFPVLTLRLGPYRLRRAVAGDIPALMELFRGTVLTINRRDYTQPQTLDWASCGQDRAKWERMIAENYFLVATDRSGQLVGYASLTGEGYLHSLFVHKDYQGKGIAAMLLLVTEGYAYGKGIRRILSDVSITARPFFAGHGYTVVRQQCKKADKMYLTNLRMEKSLR